MFLRGLGKFGLLLCRRPKSGIALGLLLLLLCAVVGVPLWANYHFRAAQRACQEERYGEALEHVNSCLLVWPRNPEVHLLAARVERLRENYSQAEHHLNECFRLQKGASQASQLEWLLMRTQRGEIDELAPALWTWIQNDRSATTAVMETLSRTYIREMRLQRALDCLDAWLAHEPDTVRALSWRALVYDRLSRTQAAIDEYRRALELAPDHDTVRLRLAELLLSRNLPAEALPHLDRLSQKEPVPPAIAVARARCWLSLNRTAEARELLAKVHAAHPKNVDALLVLGKLESQEQHFERAERCFREALQLSPHELEGQRALWDSLRVQPGKEKDAAAQLQQYERLKADADRLDQLLTKEVPRSPDNPEVLSEVGSLFLKAGQDQQGLLWLYSALKKDAAHRKAHALLAEYYDQKNEPKKAAQHRRFLGQGAPPKRSAAPAATSPLARPGQLAADGVPVPAGGARTPGAIDPPTVRRAGGVTRPRLRIAH